MIRRVIRRPLPSLGLGGEAPGNRANPLFVTGLETAAGLFSFHWAQGRAQGVYLLNCHWAQGRPQGLYLLQVLTLLLGTSRSTGHKAGSKESICYGS